MMMMIAAKTTAATKKEQKLHLLTAILSIDVSTRNKNEQQQDAQNNAEL
jgi:hypothetical protein